MTWQIAAISEIGLSVPISLLAYITETSAVSLQRRFLNGFRQRACQIRRFPSHSTLKP